MKSLKDIAEEIAQECFFKINREANKERGNEVKYPAQFILEELIKILESKV